jgi:hypothetical protein
MVLFPVSDSARQKLIKNCEALLLIIYGVRPVWRKKWQQW